MSNFLNFTKVSKDKRAKFTSVLEESSDFRKIYKPYRKVNNYPDFREVANGLTMSTLSAEVMGLNNVDTTLKEVAYSAKNNKSASPTHFLNPVWIGKEYKPKQRKANNADEEISRKYQIRTKHFWRRGHYRYISVGKREEGQRKLTWIEPVLISR